MSDTEEESKRDFPLFELGCLLVLMIFIVIIILALLGPSIANVMGIGLPGMY